MFSALPILFLLLSKTLSSTVFSWLAQSMDDKSRTRLCKLFNGIASLGLAISIACVPQFDKENALSAVASLCMAMLFAGKFGCVGFNCEFSGLHTPGVQTALLQLAPPFTGKYFLDSF
jgi:hypothetical protein